MLDTREPFNPFNGRTREVRRLLGLALQATPARADWQGVCQEQGFFHKSLEATFVDW
jgi:hypothetical protein